MKKLNQLVPCDYDINIESIEDDSRIKTDNYLFCCIEGLTVDGHKYIEDAINNGAVAILAQKDIKAAVPVVKVEDTNKGMLDVLSNFYDNVDQKIKLIGVTGTDGKTTTTSIIYQLINQVDNCGYIGTNGLMCGDFSIKTEYTTPFPKELFKAFNDFKNSGCNYVTMEVSSERLLTRRLDGLKFDVAILTNLTSDHLDKHKTLANYRRSKARLFEMLKDDGYAIINADDEHANYFKKHSNGKVLTYGIDKRADIMATNMIISEKRLRFNLKINDNEYYIESPLSGKFNVYNLMAAIGTCYVLGHNINDIVEKIRYLEPINGRAIIIDTKKNYKVIIDYAHTANSLKNLLQYAHVIAGNRLITVTGSAGGRDKDKRPEMGKVVTSLSDYVIFTADDPRYEDPNDIIDEMLTNVDSRNHERVIDRVLAIKKALSLAVAGDVVIIAGRGDDTYMPVGDGFVRCNDKEEVYKILAEEPISI
jgi:UDP-N-acetylmuramoyl-L-alanyl-D-glutamate--2,6-diaminopimelate ligase